jgi:hypothetical protein
VLSDGRGRFRFEELPPGSYTLKARALGYVGASYTFTIPHGGELGLFRFPLTPVRVVVRGLFEDLSTEVTRQGEVWGRLTPRQLQGVLLEALRPELREEGGQGALQEEGYKAFRASLERALGQQDAQELGASGVVAAITHVIEEVYYSRRLHEEEIIDLMERLVQRARQRVAGGEG